MIVYKGVQGILASLQTESWEVALGSGHTQPWFDNLTLENEVDRQPADASLLTTIFTNDSLFFEGRFTFAEVVSLSEVGIFNAEGTPYLLSRKVFTPFDLPVGQPIDVAIKVICKL